MFRALLRSVRQEARKRDRGRKPHGCRGLKLPRSSFHWTETPCIRKSVLVFYVSKNYQNIPLHRSPQAERRNRQSSPGVEVATINLSTGPKSHSCLRKSVPAFYVSKNDQNMPLHRSPQAERRDQQPPPVRKVPGSSHSSILQPFVGKSSPRVSTPTPTSGNRADAAQGE